MTVAATVLAVWLMMRIAGDTPTGRVMRAWLVERPAAWMARISPGHVVLATALVAIVSLVIWFGEGDGIALLSMSAPELVGALATFEVSAYVEVLTAVVLASSTMRLRATWAVLRGAIARRIARSGRRAVRTRRPAGPPVANDDEEGRGSVRAARAA